MLIRKLQALYSSLNQLEGQGWMSVKAAAAAVGGKVEGSEAWFSKLTCAEVREIPKASLEKCFQDVGVASFIYRAVRGIDTQAIQPSQFLPKNISVDNTQLPHPQNLAEIHTKLLVILSSLLKLVRRRLEEFDELPQTIKVTICNRKKISNLVRSKEEAAPRNRILYDRQVHARQCGLAYHLHKKKRFEALDEAMLLKVVKKLAGEIVSQYFSKNQGDDPPLDVARLNISTSGFAKFEHLRKKFFTSTLVEAFKTARKDPTKHSAKLENSSSRGSANVEVIDLVDEPEIDNTGEAHHRTKMEKSISTGFPIGVQHKEKRAEGAHLRNTSQRTKKKRSRINTFFQKI